jgi:regulator of cell morphogenesis and NO signaling
MPALHDTTVGELVAADPRLAGVFERFGIDYCCGGRVPLDEAVRRVGADYPAVLAAINAAAEAPPQADDPAGMSLAELCDHIVETHHAFLRAELPRIGRMLDKVVAAHADRHPELPQLRRVAEAFTADLVRHMSKEELILFPAIARLERERQVLSGPFGSIRRPMAVMETEHDQAGDALELMRALTDGFTPPADTCPTYQALLVALADLEADMHQHVHKENNVLFPRAIRLEEEILASDNPASQFREVPLL